MVQASLVISFSLSLLVNDLPAPPLLLSLALSRSLSLSEDRLSQCLAAVPMATRQEVSVPLMADILIS